MTRIPRVPLLIVVMAFILSGCFGSSGSSGNNTPSTPDNENSQPQITELRLDVLRVELPAGTSKQLVATAVFADGGTENVTTDAEWSATNDTVAAFDDSAPGLLRAIAVGDSSLSAAYQGLNAAAEVDVLPGDLVELRVEPAGPLEVFVGGTQQFRALATFEGLPDERDITGDTVWTSDTDSIATVDSDGGQAGMVEGVTAGETTITASFSSSGSDVTKSDSVAITVKDVAVEAELSIVAPPTIDEGAVVQLTATLDDEDVTGQVQWGSNDEDVLRFLDASLSPGLAAGFAEGNVAASATLGEKSANTFIDVLAAPNSPRSLSLSATPNVILASDATDSADLVALVRTNQEGAPLSPERDIEFSVGGSQGTLFEREAGTREGEATVDFHTDQPGFYLIEARVEGTLAQDSLPIAVVQGFGQIIARATAIVEPPQLDGQEAALVVLFNLSNRDFRIEQIRLMRGEDLAPGFDPIEGDSLLDASLPGNGTADALVPTTEDMDLSEKRVEFDLLDERTGTPFTIRVSLPTE